SGGHVRLGPLVRPQRPRPQTPDGLKNQPVRRLRSGVWGGAPEGRDGTGRGGGGETTKPQPSFDSSSATISFTAIADCSPDSMSLSWTTPSARSRSPATMV